MRAVDIIRGLIVLAALAAIGAGRASQACEVRVAPNLDIKTNFYSDERGSVIDPGKLDQRMGEMKPVRELVRYAIELGAAGTYDCLALNYGKWAEQRFLLDPPANFVAAVERQRIVFGLSLPAVLATANKRRLPLPAATTQWLVAANAQVADYFARRGRLDNLYAWSIPNATAILFFVQDPHREAMADEMWTRAVNTISADGSVKSELERGQKALWYHEYHLSALLVSAALRMARGRPVSERDMSRIGLLANYVSKNTCDSTEIQSRANARQMDRLGALNVAFRVYLGNTVRLPPQIECVTMPVDSYVDFFGRLEAISAAARPN